MSGVNWEEFRAAFQAELEDHVRSLNQLLLRLERSVDEDRGEIWDSLFRDAHSLKGAARSIGMLEIERVAHGLESALDEARKGGAKPAGPWFDAVYQAVDALLPLNGAGANTVDVRTILAALAHEVRPAGVKSEEPPAVAEQSSPEDPGTQSPRPGSHDGTPSSGNGNAELSSAGAPDRGRLSARLTAGVRGLRNGPPAASPLEPAPPVSMMPAGTLASRAGGNGTESARTSGARAVAPAPNPMLADAARHATAEAESVRVGVKKLDALLAQAGELSVARIRVEQRLRDVRALAEEIDVWRRERRRTRGLWTALTTHAVTSHELEALRRHQEQAEEQVNQLAATVQALLTRFRGDVAELGGVTQMISEEVVKARLIPAATVLGPFERMVRDLAHATGKDVDLVLEGAEMEIDRRILEQLRDPIMHMLRNAVDHGIEAPPEREAAGKPRMGTILLSVFQRGDTIAVVVKDDGRGLDPDKLRESAVAKGVMTRRDADALDDRSALELIFLPGFSTARTVTETSGRGVGMDVVRENLTRIDGRIEIDSTPGSGTTFILDVPLSVVTTRAVLAEVAGTVFGIPTHAIERLVRARGADVQSFEGRQAIALDGQPVAAAPLGAVLGIPRRVMPSNDLRRPGIVVRHGDRRVALLVDGLPGEQELVVKALRWPLRRVRHVSGAAVLDSGETILVLDAPALVRSAVGLVRSGTPSTGVGDEQRGERDEPRRILVVDDSATTRTLERSILESAGYRVTVAANGVEALRVLKEAMVDLVVSDVDMPQMDGFGLTTEIRRDDRLRQIPVILVTSLEAREYRERGLAAGADAYIVKSGFDQGLLLDTIGRLL